MPKIYFDKVEPLFKIGGGRNNRSSSSYFVSLFAQESSLRTPPRAICRRNWEITFCSRLFLLLLLQLPILTPFAKSPKGFQRQRENIRGFSFSFAVRKQERGEKALRQEAPQTKNRPCIRSRHQRETEIAHFREEKRGKDAKNIVSVT